MGTETVNSTGEALTQIERAAGLQAHISPWISVPAVFIAWAFIMTAVKKIAFAMVRKFAARTTTQLDDILLDALDFPLQLLIYATGILLVQNLVPAGQVDISKYLMDGFKIVGILAAVLFVDKFLRGLIDLYAVKVEILKTSGGIAQGVIRVVVLVLGGLVLLDSFGVSITPIIASLGIGSLAVALALQPTLENFFSGIQIIADKPIQVGQFIKLESGEEGTVVKIGWRSTWICQPNNNTVIIPNKALVGSRVMNYFYPDTEMAVLVGIGVHYNSDLEHVERVATDVGAKVMKECTGGVPSFTPFIRYHTFGESSIDFNVILRARDWPSTHLVKHEYIKQVKERFAAEGIVIPYPIRTVIQEK